MAKYDYELGAIADTGLTEVEMDAVLSLVLGHVHSTVRGAVAAARIEQDTGVSDEQWWQAHRPVFEKIFNPASYPTAVRVGGAVGETYQAAYVPPEQLFSFGLERVLDGVEVLIARRRG